MMAKSLGPFDRFISPLSKLALDAAMVKPSAFSHPRIVAPGRLWLFEGLRPHRGLRILLSGQRFRNLRPSVEKFEPGPRSFGSEAEPNFLDPRFQDWTRDLGRGDQRAHPELGPTRGASRNWSHRAEDSCPQQRCFGSWRRQERHLRRGDSKAFGLESLRL